MLVKFIMDDLAADTQYPEAIAAKQRLLAAGIMSAWRGEEITCEPGNGFSGAFFYGNEGRRRPIRKASVSVTMAFPDGAVCLVSADWLPNGLDKRLLPGSLTIANTQKGKKRTRSFVCQIEDGELIASMTGETVEDVVGWKPKSPRPRGQLKII